MAKCFDRCTLSNLCIFNDTIGSDANLIGHRTAAGNSDAYWVPPELSRAPVSEPLLRAAGAGQWGNLGTQTPSNNKTCRNKQKRTGGG